MSDTHTPPNLTVVDSQAEKAEVTSATEPEAVATETAAARPGSTSRGWIGWLLLAAAVVFAWQWLTQLGQVEALEAEVAVLEGKLTEAQAEIVAWESHSVAVKGAVADATAGIAAQLGALETLVSGGPGGVAEPVLAEPAPAVPSAPTAPEGL